MVVPGRLWFVGLRPVEPDPREARRLIHRMGARAGGGQGAVVPAFTGKNLAVRFIGGLVGGGMGLVPVSWPTPGDLAFALAYLAELDVTHIVFDPEPGPDRGRLFIITEVIDGLV